MTNKKQILTTVLSVLVSVGLVATAAYATTTIGTDIDTGGTLTVGGDITLENSATIANTTDVLTVTEPTVTLAGATKINLDGPTTVTGKLYMDSITAGNNFEIGVFSTGGTGEGLVINDTYFTGLGVYSEVLAESAGSVVTRGIHSRHLVTAAQGNMVSLLGAELQLRVKANLGDGSHFGSWNYFEQSGSVTLASPGTNGAALFTVEGASTLTVDSGAYLAGVMIDSSVDDSATINGNFDAIYIKKTSGKKVWTNGIKIANSAATTGIDVGTATTGIDFTGTYTNAIDFSDTTYAPSGSNGASLIRAGTYASPLDIGTDEYQSGLIRLYTTTSAGGTSYDRGIFVATKTTNTKGVFPIAGLAEVNDVASGNGPNKVQAAQFISHLNSTTAKLAALGGDSTAGMYGAWLKVTANEGATTASGSRVAPLWVDNQLYGSNINAGMEEYGIFATTGGTVPDAFIGFETSSSGWDSLLYFDETSYDEKPVVSGDIDGGTAGYYLRVNLNGTIYGIQLYEL